LTHWIGHFCSMFWPIWVLVSAIYDLCHPLFSNN
jgi:hypothetical protein